MRLVELLQPQLRASQVGTRLEAVERHASRQDVVAKALLRERGFFEPEVRAPEHPMRFERALGRGVASDQSVELVDGFLPFAGLEGFLALGPQQLGLRRRARS